MENLPKIAKKKKRIPLSIPVHPYLRDHMFLGKAVLPAVESMELLSSCIASHYPELNAKIIGNVELTRFIQIPDTGDAIEAGAEIEWFGDGKARVKLITLHRGNMSSATRSMEHVTAEFTASGEASDEPPMDLVAGLEGIALEIDADRLYGDLVPFGPSYRNAGKIFIAESGASSLVSGGSFPEKERSLGSPFPMDAAFHAACAWGQRALGYVGFPISIKKREVLDPTVPGETYLARIFRRHGDGESFAVDIYIYTLDGRLCEAALGLVMKDISAGKLAPPSWILDGRGNGPNAAAGACKAFTVMEIAPIPNFAEKALSEKEMARMAAMGEKRKRSFLAGRLACKSLSRKLSKNDHKTPAHLIETIREGSERPFSPLTNGKDPFKCAVSHDSRFVVAAAAKGAIGVDVETYSDRVVRTRRFFVRQEEEALIKKSGLGETGACLRIWTIKEAVAKTLDITLPEAWKRTSVTVIGRDRSRIMIDKKERGVIHDTVEGHLFTLFTLN